MGHKELNREEYSVCAREGVVEKRVGLGSREKEGS